MICSKCFSKEVARIDIKLYIHQINIFITVVVVVVSDVLLLLQGSLAFLSPTCTYIHTDTNTHTHTHSFSHRTPTPTSRTIDCWQRDKLFLGSLMVVILYTEKRNVRSINDNNDDGSNMAADTNDTSSIYIRWRHVQNSISHFTSK